MIRQTLAHYRITAQLGEGGMGVAYRARGLRDRVLTESGETRRHVNTFVANEDIRYTGGLAMQVQDGAVVSIVPAISGGITF